MKTPKANYKIWIKSKKIYFKAGYNSKATWSSMHWVLEASKKASKSRRQRAKASDRKQKQAKTSKK